MELESFIYRLNITVIQSFLPYCIQFIAASYSSLVEVLTLAKGRLFVGL